MLRENLDAISAGALKSVQEAEETPLRYLMRSAMGGAFLFVGVFLSIMVSAQLQSLHGGLGKVASAFVFPIGLVLIIVLAGQLYTSTCLYQPVGLLMGRVKAGQGIRVMALCWVGNMLGLAVMSALLTASGAQRSIMLPYLVELVEARVAVGAMQIFLRGILCNFYICVSSFVAFRMNSEAGKIIVIFFVIAGFILSGTDHSIANAGFFFLCKMLAPATKTLPLLRNVALATAGNFIGGAGLVALPMWYVGSERVKH